MVNPPRPFSSRKAVFFALLGFATALHAQIPAFPGAEGFGAFATGGRGGDVYHVTNTNSSGAGSLVSGLTTGVPAAGRTIVFDVSGYLNITSTLRVTANKITIAGQTAPGDGFGLKSNTFLVSGDDLVVRHFRFRDGVAGDAIDLDSNSINVIFDHCDAIFAHDENMSSYNSPPENLTFQWSNNAWGLETHSAGGLWDMNHVTVHHTLWAHNHTRNPKARPNGLLDWVNNVTFDWDIGFILGDSQTPADWKTNVIGSYFISSSSTGSAFNSASKDSNGNPNFSVYLRGNLLDGDADKILDGTDRGSSILGSSLANVNLLTSAVARTAGKLVTEDENALLAYKKIVSAVGPLRLDANPSRPLRDELNTILINNLVTQRKQRITYGALGNSGASNGGYGTLISSPVPTDTDQDGMPDYWEKAVGLSSTVASNNGVLPSAGGIITGTTYFPPNTPAGYTNLEEYLHYLAIPHRAVFKNTAAAPTALAIDLSRYTKGFASSPAFVLANLVGGTATQSGAGGAQVNFVPTPDMTGRAQFDFTVTDAAGSAWTQRFAILVSGDPLPVDPVSIPLIWRGNGATHVWNNTTGNTVWLDGATPAGWGATDTATFDNSGSNAPAVTISGTVQPSAVTVDSAQDYTFAGSGAIGGAAALTKAGSGTLTLANTGGNAFALDISLQAGTVVIGNGSSLGNGPVDFFGGTLTSGYAASSTHNLVNILTIPAGCAATVNLSAQMNVGGASGSGTLNLTVPGVTADREHLAGSWSGFTGTLNLKGTATGALISANFNGSATVGSFNNLNAATVNLEAVNLGGRNNSGGNTFTIGALNGNATSKLGGAHYAGVLTYSIGALNKDMTFAGAITNSTSSTDTASGNATKFTKVGSGTMTLSGASTHTGATAVSAGKLFVNGSLGSTAVTVASGATLGGSGTIGSASGGAVTASGGAILSPGGAPGQVGILKVGNGLTLGGNTLLFDLSSNPAGTNDRITLQGGTLVSTGTQIFTINFPDGHPAAGTYPLITGGATSASSAATVSYTPPPGTRQTFSLASTAATPFVQLNVTGSVADLIWTGGAGGTWDLNTTANWRNGVAADKFYNLDKAIFDNSASTGAVTLSGSIQPREVLVNNSSLAYTFSGTGLNGGALLTKSGPGTLTLTTANSYTRGTLLNDGVLAINSGSSLGSGLVTLNGGTLLFNTAALTVANAFKITAPTTLSLTGGGNFHSGDFSGSGALTLNLPAGATFTAQGSFAGFTGSLTLSGSGILRFNQGTNSWGGAAAAFDAGASGTVNNRASGDITVYLGALSGGSSAQLRGSDQVGPGVDTYIVGGLNLSTVFAGALLDGSNTPPHTTALTKTGPGLLTLSGASTHSSETVVAQGTLRVSGSITNHSTAEVLNAATLHLNGGTLSMDQISVDAGGTLLGCGTINADLVSSGTVLANCGGTLTINGEVVNNGTLRVTSGTQLAVNGAFTNTGVLDVMSGSVSAAFLASVINEGGVILDSSKVRAIAATKTGNSFSVTIQGYANHLYRLEGTSSLAAPVWTPVADPQAGNNAPLTFTDSTGATGAQKFYRVAIDP